MWILFIADAPSRVLQIFHNSGVATVMSWDIYLTGIRLCVVRNKVCVCVCVHCQWLHVRHCLRCIGYHLIPEWPKYWFKIYCFENIWNYVFRASVEFIFLNVYLLQFLKLPFTIINFINDYRYNIVGVFYFMILLHSNAAALWLGGLWLSRVFSVKISNIWEATLLRQPKDTLS